MANNNKNLRSEFLKTMAGLITAAFGLVAALAWNDTIKALINHFFPEGDGFKSMLIYAMIVTCLAVLVTYYLGKLTQEAKEEEEKKNG
ncbi:hypothetical protein A2V71_02860 [Candidatus Berkelbacteria bacterium RBG_13_40_8]|uniref:Uncharacterized protein n=1 Tax=Candidatus Berkelbacteria bacterium RBG_13_40_8 TaxID=1797467 RepID=A0A1F5DM40_9BACT|nr:MAG: hypothetical protein A2V71_02860 [Candidatus Berkelbacteria bacterium RBG_13_40_8]